MSEKLKEEYNIYEDILKSVYEIKKLSGNDELNEYISYIKGVKKGLEISLNNYK